MSYKDLLDTWSEAVEPPLTEEHYAVRLTVDDAARVKALADLFPGMEVERIIADLLSIAIAEVEAAIPYEAGSEVIREDEFGDPVYADAGMTPRFRELVQSHKEQLEA
jgi:hypothetical protein